MLRQVHIGACACVLLSGCSDGPDATRPTPTPTVTSIAITSGTDMLMLRSTETFAASVTRSDGSAAAMAVTWSSDDPGVATVTPQGLVTGNAPGQTVIKAAAGAQQAQRSLRVVPRYDGNWDGTARVTSCSADGDWIGICDGFTGGGFGLAVTQNRDAVTSELDLGADAKGPISGTIEVDGRLPMEGALRWEIEGLVFTLAVREWESRTTDNQSMSGRFTVEVRHQMFDGLWRFEMNHSATKAPGTASVVVGSGGSGRMIGERLAAFVGQAKVRIR